jgi:hypothetical protein
MTGRSPATTEVAQTFKSAVSRVSKPAAGTDPTPSRFGNRRCSRFGNLVWKPALHSVIRHSVIRHSVIRHSSFPFPSSPPNPGAFAGSVRKAPKTHPLSSKGGGGWGLRENVRASVLECAAAAALWFRTRGSGQGAITEDFPAPRFRKRRSGAALQNLAGRGLSWNNDFTLGRFFCFTRADSRGILWGLLS